ncbi:MAG: DALR domain-containing protein, partial [bacterium]
AMYARLNLQPPEVEPYASRHVPEIIDLIRALEAKGLTYAAAGDVLFRVRKFPGYGKLSGNSVDRLQPGARIERESHAEDPLDFALWKGEKPGEPAWDSPWGRGRPGWHIECSAMSMKYLGETFDLHGGGHDLVFPHHENEIAQSEAATGKSFARIWTHPGWVTFNREKMSKSLGNVLPMQVVLDRLPAPALRLLICQTHYRSPFEWSDVAERQAKETMESLQRDLDLGPSVSGGTEEGTLAADAEKHLAAFDAAMDDDLGTPRAVAEIFPLAARVRGERMQGRASFGALKRVRDEVLRRLDALGIRIELSSAGGPPAEVAALVKEREDARTRKEWARSDELRAEIMRRGWSVEDTPTGSVARK